MGIGFLIVCWAAFEGLRHIRGFPTDVAQTYVFPVVLLAATLSLAGASLRPPRLVAGLLLCAWGLCGLHVRGLPPFGEKGAHIVMASLGDGAEEGKTRSLVRRYNQVAVVHDLPEISMLHRPFADVGSMRAWLVSRPPGSLLIAGSSAWPTVSFFAERASPVDPALAGELRSLDLTLDNLALLPVDGLPHPLFLIAAPDEVQLPSDPPELFLHLLAWIGAGFSTGSHAHADPAGDQADISGFRQNAYLAATQILGPWKSGAGPALANLFFATSVLEDLAEQGVRGQKWPACAAKSLSLAAKLVPREFEHGLAAAVDNNLGVAQLLAARSLEDVQVAMDRLRQAASTQSKEGSPKAARVALLNIMLLERSGFPRLRPSALFPAALAELLATKPLKRLQSSCLRAGDIAAEIPECRICKLLCALLRLCG